jgi:hypothetical protein
MMMSMMQRSGRDVLESENGWRKMTMKMMRGRENGHVDWALNVLAVVVSKEVIHHEDSHQAHWHCPPHTVQNGAQIVVYRKWIVVSKSNRHSGHCHPLRTEQTDDCLFADCAPTIHIEMTMKLMKPTANQSLKSHVV